MRYLTKEQIADFVKNGIPEKCNLCPADDLDHDCGCESLCGIVRAKMLGEIYRLYAEENKDDLQ
jgi:hypothetical protein